jgi:hypothetical protein
MEGYEGVVNALRHVHPLLVPGGTLLDLHPVTEMRIASGDTIIGTIPEPDFATTLANVDGALERVVGDGLYTLEAASELDVLQHFETGADLLEHQAEELRGERALVERIRAASPPFVAFEHAVLRRYRVR